MSLQGRVVFLFVLAQRRLQLRPEARRGASPGVTLPANGFTSGGPSRTDAQFARRHVADRVLRPLALVPGAPIRRHLPSVC